MTSGASRNGAAPAAAANFEENSPKVRCWLRRSMSPNVATSQKTVVPPFPSRTSQPSGSEKRPASPARSEATTLRTAGWRCDVPRYPGAAAASASTASGRMREGPQPKRPSVGRRPAGMRTTSGFSLGLTG